MRQETLAIAPVLFACVIEGAPATKKTQQQVIFPALFRYKGLAGFHRKMAKVLKGGADHHAVVGFLEWAAEKVRPRIAPSQAYRKYERIAVPQMRAAWRRTGHTEPLDGPCAIEAIYYLGGRQRPDLHGLFEATGDLLMEAGVIKSDYWVTSWDGSRRLRDTERPRVELVIRGAE